MYSTLENVLYNASGGNVLVLLDRVIDNAGRQIPGEGQITSCRSHKTAASSSCFNRFDFGYLAR